MAAALLLIFTFIRLLLSLVFFLKQELFAVYAVLMFTAFVDWQSRNYRLSLVIGGVVFAVGCARFIVSIVRKIRA